MPRTKRPSYAKARDGKQKKAARKTLRQAQGKRVKVSSLRRMIRSVRWSESYTSLLMGIIAVVVGVLFVVSFLRQTHHVQQTSSTSTTAITASPGGAPSELQPGQKTYTVKAGDDLWHIAEMEYKSGYNWVDIAKANNLSDPSMIFSGNTLIVPQVTPAVATISPTLTPTPEVGLKTGQSDTITGSTYAVQKGDDLWHIAVRAYADGYQWTKIAQANALSNPSLIFSGNVLKIPR